jgi:hypothetical protein
VKLLLPLVALTMLMASRPALATPARARRIKSAILLNLLSYDRKLKSRVKGDVVIALVTDGNNASQRTAAATVFAALAKRNAQGRRIRVVSLHIVGRDQGRLATLATASGANIFWVVSGTSARTYTALLRHAKAQRLPVACGFAAPVKAGAAFAVAIIKGRPRIFVNLPAARAARVDLPASVLRLATVIR